MSLELLREKFGHSVFTHEKKADNKEKIHEKLNDDFNSFYEKIQYNLSKEKHQEQIEEKERIIENLEDPRV